jgi:hypothetical protein
MLCVFKYAVILRSLSVKKVYVAMIASILFSLGLATTPLLSRLDNSEARSAILAPSAQINSHLKMPNQAATNQNDPCKDFLEDNKFRAKLNGHKLDLNHQARFPDEYADAKLIPLSFGKMLISVGKVLYRLDSNRNVEWKYETPWVNDFAIVESTNLIYGTAGDNHMFILDASSGKVLLSDSRNGRAAYDQVKPYKEDQCLITDNFSGYRQDWNELRIPGMINAPTWKDGVTAWRGTQKLWHRDFPPDAELLVKGEKIYAVTKTKESIYVSEIEVPKALEK